MRVNQRFRAPLRGLASFARRIVCFLLHGAASIWFASVVPSLRQTCGRLEARKAQARERKSKILVSLVARFACPYSGAGAAAATAGSL